MWADNAGDISCRGAVTFTAFLLNILRSLLDFGKWWSKKFRKRFATLVMTFWLYGGLNQLIFQLLLCFDLFYTSKQLSEFFFFHVSFLWYNTDFLQCLIIRKSLSEISTCCFANDNALSSIVPLLTDKIPWYPVERMLITTYFNWTEPIYNHIWVFPLV